MLQIYFVAPPVVRMKDDIKQFLTERGIKWTEVDDLHEVAADVDVLYQTRIQKERFTDLKVGLSTCWCALWHDLDILQCA